MTSKLVMSLMTKLMIKAIVNQQQPHYQVQLLSYRQLSQTNSWEIHWRQNAHRQVARVIDEKPLWHVLIAGNYYQFRNPMATHHSHGALDSGSAGSQLLAPMPGIIHSVPVSTGDMVTANTTVMVIEAMKILTHLPIPVNARLGEIFVSEGEQVSEGQLLAEWEVTDEH